MSNSGLIYAVIVGAWAAYLVPMWLRRQDELNDARPTERFSTAIRLLSGRAAMERRYTREREQSSVSAADDDDDGKPDDTSETCEADSAYEAADVRSFADPVTEVRPRAELHEAGTASGDAASGGRPGGMSETRERQASERRPTLEPPRERDPEAKKGRPSGKAKGTGGEASRAGGGAQRSKRAQVLARRRRTTMVLFGWFTVGSVLAAVGGLGFLWAPALPAVLLTAYIGYLRAQERRRFAVRLDRQRAEAAAQHLRATRRAARAEKSPEPADVSVREHQVLSENRKAVVEQTDHAEWVDQERAGRRGVAPAGGWDPAPVPLPTYVNAPVAPRGAQRADPEASGTWSAARSGTAGPAEVSSAPRGARRTPLFDQHAAHEEHRRPRASGE